MTGCFAAAPAFLFFSSSEPSLFFFIRTSRFKKVRIKGALASEGALKKEKEGGRFPF